MLKKERKGFSFIVKNLPRRDKLGLIGLAILFGFFSTFDTFWFRLFTGIKVDFELLLFKVSYMGLIVAIAFILNILKVVGEKMGND